MAVGDRLLLEWIRERALVPEEALREALARAEAASSGGGESEERALDFLLAGGLLGEEELAVQLAAYFGLETVDVARRGPDPGLLAEVPADLARAHQLLPLAAAGPEILVAMANPLDTAGTDRLGAHLQRPVNPRVAARSDLRKAIARAYGAPESRFKGEETAAQPGGAHPSAGEAAHPSAVAVEGLDDEAVPAEAPVVRYVQHLLEEAFRRRASDIHLEPLEHRFRVRYRVDGVLEEQENPPRRLQASLLSRVKLLAGLSLAERRLPQDGRISARLGGRPVDLRVSSLPTAHGESIVLRILDKERLRLGWGELGLGGEERARFRELLTLPDGVVLVTGPTGAGKSTTLYAVLHSLNQPDRKIITVEDPVEYELPGVNQVQVRPEVGMTFASALRALLRQAPNVIMVGEIRDRETAAMVVQASLTGHLVWSTLHTNDAPSAVSRLLDLGVPPFLLAASLRAVVAQRLVRRVCPHCAVPTELEVWERRALGLRPDALSGASCRRGKGCGRCAGTGYYGRLGLFEVLIVGEELSARIDGAHSPGELRPFARPLGLRTLREDGIEKVIAGQTTCAEVLQATPRDDGEPAARRAFFPPEATASSTRS